MNTIIHNGRLIFALFGCLSLVAPICCVAADVNPTTPVSRQVSTAGLDLNTAEGARAAYARLKSAARSLCSDGGSVYRAPSWVYRECIEDALAHTVRNVNRRLMTQAFVADYGTVAAEKDGIDLGTLLAKH
jgi:UrcA family protein